VTVKWVNCISPVEMGPTSQRHWLLCYLMKSNWWAQCSCRISFNMCYTDFVVIIFQRCTVSVYSCEWSYNGRMSSGYCIFDAFHLLEAVIKVQFIDHMTSYERMPLLIHYWSCSPNSIRDSSLLNSSPIECLLSVLLHHIYMYIYIYVFYRATSV